MKENANIKQFREEDSLALRAVTDGFSKVKMTGECIDRIYKNGVLVDEIVGHNLVVSSFLNLVMCLLKRQSGYSGIQYWAIGSGATSWDSNTPSPSLDATKLTAEIGRSVINPSDIKFLNNNYEEVSTPTPIIQISHTFGTDECNGTWREFGIFGGNATASANSGIMINKRHHSVITKTTDMTIERIMRFTIKLA